MPTNPRSAPSAARTGLSRGFARGAALLALALLVAACGEDTDRLAQLKADPAYSFVPPGAHPAGCTEDLGQGGIDSPAHANETASCNYTVSGAPQSALHAAYRSFASDGWRPFQAQCDWGATDPTFVSIGFSRQLDGWWAQLGLTYSAGKMIISLSAPPPHGIGAPPASTADRAADAACLSRIGS